MTIKVENLPAATLAGSSDEVLLQQSGTLKRAPLNVPWSFGGAVTVGGNLTVSAGKLSITNAGAGNEVALFTGQYATLGSVNLAAFERFGSAVKAAVIYDDAQSPINIAFGTTTNHGVRIITNGTTGITVDNSQNTALAGNLTVNGSVTTFAPSVGETVVLSRDSASPYIGTTSNHDFSLLAGSARVVQLAYVSGADRRLNITPGVSGSGTRPTFGASSGGSIGLAEDTDLYLGSSASTGSIYIGGGSGAMLSSNGGSSALVLGINDSEKARITSGGYFKASNSGTYVASAGAYHELVGNENGGAMLALSHTHASAPRGFRVDFTAASPDDNTAYFLICADSTTNRCIVYSDGDLQNHDNSYGAISDRRLKQDIMPASSQVDDVEALAAKLSKYRHQSDVESGKDHLQLGWVSQEIMSISPGLVQKRRNGLYMEQSVQYSVAYLKAFKALGEIIGRVKKLESRINLI